MLHYSSISCWTLEREAWRVTKSKFLNVIKKAHSDGVSAILRTIYNSDYPIVSGMHNFLMKKGIFQA